MCFLRYNYYCVNVRASHPFSVPVNAFTEFKRLVMSNYGTLLLLLLLSGGNKSVSLNGGSIAGIVIGVVVVVLFVVVIALLVVRRGRYVNTVLHIWFVLRNVFKEHIQKSVLLNKTTSNVSVCFYF